MVNALAKLTMACAVLAAGTRVFAADPTDVRPLNLAKGSSSATIKGSLQGTQTIDYKLRASAGQTLSVTLKSSNGANHFNVLPPGSKDVAIFIGSTGGYAWSATLGADGEYTLRVYLMRSAARRNETANFTLTVGIGGGSAGTASLGTAPPGDARVKGTRYHATGPLPCSMGHAPARSTQCEFGVIRGKPGNAELHIKPTGGLERVLTFMGNSVTSGNEKVKASKTEGLWTIEVNGDEHYQVPEAVISGG